MSALIAYGRANREISVTLFLALSMVERYVANI
jgi:DNA-binding NarL/FixJ family response regulator